MARTIVPVADLRIEPQDLLPKNFDHHNLRDSQLLFNEEVSILETKGEWVRVAALEQPCFSEESGWHHCTGWVHRSEIGEGSLTPRFVMAALSDHYSFGTYLDKQVDGARPIPPQPNSKQLIRDAEQFLDLPYLWGGRASALPNTIASVDCSGLINLLYRAQGICIPRNAHDQYLVGRPVEMMQPGDALYLAKEKRVTHVVLKMADGVFIEAPQSGQRVRLLHEGKEYWREGERWHFQGREGSYVGYPISFIGK